MRFLVVEDDDSAARALARLLKAYGQVILATTAGEAERMLDAPEPWSALFVDLGLPDGSGLDVLARARESQPSTPAMVLTGCTEGDAINAAFDLCAEYVVKPVSRARIARFLAGRGEFRVRLRDAVAAWKARYRLSEAEADVLERAAAGVSREGLAAARGCSPLTVKAHVANLLRKTGDASFSACVGRLLRTVAGASGHDTD